MSDAIPSPVPASTESPRRRVVNALRQRLSHADPGTLAALRRAGGSDSPPAAFYRLTVGILDEHDEKLPEAGPLRDRIEARFSVVAAAMATGIDFLAPIPLGKALADADIAEMRVLRLLEASEAQLPELVRGMVHQLVQKGQPFDPQELADLVLNPDSPAPRRRIARDFYRYQKA